MPLSPPPTPRGTLQIPDEVSSPKSEGPGGPARSMLERCLEGVHAPTVQGQTSEGRPLMVALSIAVHDHRDARVLGAVRRSVTGSPRGAPTPPMSSRPHHSHPHSGHGGGHSGGLPPLAGAASQEYRAAPREIVATVIALDSAFTASMVLPVKLPTVAMLDKESAEVRPSPSQPPHLSPSFHPYLRPCLLSRSASESSPAPPP